MKTYKVKSLNVILVGDHEAYIYDDEYVKEGSDEAEALIEAKQLHIKEWNDKLGDWMLEALEKEYPDADLSVDVKTGTEDDTIISDLTFEDEAHGKDDKIRFEVQDNIYELYVSLQERWQDIKL
jgi:hypothetical protein